MEVLVFPVGGYSGVVVEGRLCCLTLGEVLFDNGM